jgi:hypothetical protein
MVIIEEELSSSEVHIIVGQMWGYSMVCNALKRIRGPGFSIINVSMDDRYANLGILFYFGHKFALV